MSATPATTRTRATQSSGVRATVASALGTVSEWYAYGIYGTASALYIGPLFFSNTDPATATIAAFATFAVGYFARPLGGIVLGQFGDRRGRRAMLMLTISIMAVATVLVGLLPTYAQIGIWAPVLLVLLRLIEGFGAGAELAGALTFVNESAPPKRRAFFTSFMGAASYSGILLGTATFAILNAALPGEQMLEWGWRVPFLLSGVIVIVPIIMRSRLSETEPFKRVASENRRSVALVELLRERKLAILAGFLSQAVIGFSSFVVAVFALSYMTNTLQLPPQQGLLSILIAGPIAIVAALLFGRLADRIGAVRVLILSGVLSALFAFPFFLLMDTANPVLIVIAIAIGYSLSYGLTSGAQGVFLPSLFDTRYRLSGVAISRELTNALVGGTAPLVASALVLALGGAPWLVAGAMVLAGVLTVTGVLIAVPLLRARNETAALRGSSAHDDTPSEPTSTPIHNH